MPFVSKRQQRWGHATHQPFARRWDKETPDFAALPERKDDGAMLHGPGGLLATPGLGARRKGRRWGNRTKDEGCTCGVATKSEQIAPGITRIRGNLCNVHGRYGPCDQSGAANVQRGDRLSRTPKPSKRRSTSGSKRAAAGGKKRAGGGGKAPAKPKQPVKTPEERQVERDAKRAENRAKVLEGLSIDAGAQQALSDLRDGKQPDAAALERAGFLSAGLVEQAADGTYRMTGSGRSLLGAADAGDAGRAGDTISAARDRTSARTAREQTAADRKRATEERRKKGGGGGKKQTAPKAPTPEQQQRDAERKRRQAEADARRVQRETERTQRQTAADRRRAEADARRTGADTRRQAQAAQREEQRQRGLTDLAQRMEAGTSRLSDEELQRLVVEGLAERQGDMIRMTAAGRRQARRKPQTSPKMPAGPVRQKTKAASPQQRVDRLWASGVDLNDITGIWYSPSDGTWFVSGGDWAASGTGDKVRAVFGPDVVWADEGVPDKDSDEAKFTVRMKNLRVVETGGDTIQGNATAPEAYGHARTYGEISRQWLDQLVQQGYAYQAPGNGYALYEPGEIVARHPNLQAELDRIRESRRPDLKSFIVFKDDTDAYRWVMRTTTAYRDRDREILTSAGLDADAQRMTATKQYGPLRYWHIGQPDPFSPSAPWGAGLDIGDCDYSVFVGRTSIESGTFKSAAIGRAFAKSADDYEASPGFFHPPDQPNAAGEYDTIRRFERSVVPIRYGRASNLFTGLTVKEHRMDQKTYEERVKAFMADMNGKGVPPEVAAQTLASMEHADKSATAQGIAYKSDDAPQVYYLGDGTPGLLQDGRFVALKAAAPVAAEKADMPAEEMIQAGETETDDGEVDMADEPGGEPQYIGDMTPAEFWAELQKYLAPVLKMQDMVKAVGDHMGELKTMYSTKDAGTLTRIAQLETELATLKGDQPSITTNDALAALKSTGPQSPPNADAPQVPDDPNRPMAGIAAGLLPHLYGGASTPVQGFANGWQLGQPQPPQNTGGN